MHPPVYKRVTQHMYTLSTSSVSWQMSRLVSDYVPARPHRTVYRRRPSFSGRRCSCLEQSAWTCHFRSFCGCLPVPSQDTSVWHIISRPRVIVQCLDSDARCFRTLRPCYLLTYITRCYILIVTVCCWVSNGVICRWRTQPSRAQC